MTSSPPHPDDEKALIEASRRGEPGAFERLVELYRPIVRRHVTYLLSQYGCTHLISEHLDEITQQIWAELLGKVHKFPEDRFASWFAFLRRWKTIDYIRKEIKYQHRYKVGKLNPGEAVKNPSVQQNCPEENLRNKQLRLQIRLCLDKLPEKQQEFVRLYYFKGWTYDRIAKHLGIGIGSVGSIHTRAMKKLRKYLEKNKIPES